MQIFMQMKGEQFQILNCENQYLVHPIIFGILPVWKESSPFQFGFHLSLDNYKISLNQMWISTDCALPIINGNLPKYCTKDSQQGVVYEHLSIPVLYTGAILMANTLVNDYGIEPTEDGTFPCYCYKTVYEYIFENGILITTIDHSRAMLRIRKNLDLGYRNLHRKRDIRCIKQFIKTSLVGDYKKMGNKKIHQYLSKMSQIYQDNPCISVEVNVE